MAQQHVIETNKRFSESSIWSMQRSYYHDQGVDAWSADVPFYITSNPYIANSYAMVVIRFIQDWLRLHPGAEKKPFYVMEMGAGTGQFSFYVIKRLAELQHQLQLQKVKIIYVITDFTENNLKFWTDHPALKPYIEKGVVDFAIYDIEKSKAPVLFRSKTVLDQKTLTNPLVIFANYLFDSIISDIFSVKEKTLFESLLTLSVAKKQEVKDLEKIKINFSELPVNCSYYPEKEFNTILKEYEDDFESTHFLFPVESMRGLLNLKKLANDRLFLISSDKGFASLAEQDEMDPPELDFHGSFSIMVNYDAIGRLFRNLGGSAFIPDARDGLVTGVFNSGFDLSKMTETKLAMEEYIEGFNPSDYFNLYEDIAKHIKNATIEKITSFLTLSRWDPFIFEEVVDRLTELAEQDNTILVQYVNDHVDKVADNFYFLPGAFDTLFEIAVWLQNNDEYVKALEYFELSEHHFGEAFPTYYNKAICWQALEDKRNARMAVEKALQLEPKDVDAKRLLKELT